MTQLTEKQKKILGKYADMSNESQSGDPDVDRVARIRETMQPTSEKGLFGNIADTAKEGGTQFGEGFNQTVEAGKSGDIGLMGRGILNEMSGGISTMFSPITGTLKSVAKLPVISQVLDVIKSGVKGSSGVISENKALQEFAMNNPNAEEVIGNLVNIVSSITGGSKAPEIKGAVTSTIGKVTGATRNATAKLVDKAKPMITPPVNPLEAVGQVLQGGTKDIKSGVKALSAVNTKGVKTFKDLQNVLNNKITSLSDQVDSDLAKDLTIRKLDDLTVSATTKAGQIVKTNPVETALMQLDELYTKTGDTLASANIKELLNTAKTTGLTKLEVNDIARVYGQEFSGKAFSKIGEPLTSVNAQMFENTRSAVKDVARSGITGKEAKLADQLMSNTYRVRDLISKNVEAVNKLKQRIQERGLLEKFGHAVSKYADVLTGGSLRGFVGGMLPRGAGYKVLNALDLEDALVKNLKIINSAVESGSLKETVSILRPYLNTSAKTTQIPKNTATPTAKAGATAQSIKKSNKTAIPKTVPPTKSTVKGASVDKEAFTKFERDASLVGQDAVVQEKAIKKYLTEKDQLLKDYLKDNGKVVNTDEARKYFKDSGYIGSNAAAVQEPSSALAKDAWRTLLKNSEGEDALIYAGGSGTGKTSAVKNVLPEEVASAGAILDGNLSSIKSANARINEAIAAGKKPTIVYVYRDPVDAWVNGVVKRMKGNASEGGRVVPLSVFVENHKGSYNVVNELMNREGLNIDLVDNSLGANKAALMSQGKFDSIKYQTNLKETLLAKTKELYEQGAINKTQYEALIK